MGSEDADGPACLVCDAAWSQPHTSISQLRARCSQRPLSSLLAELAGAPTPGEAVLCRACSRLLNQLDEHEWRADRLRLRLRQAYDRSQLSRCRQRQGDGNAPPLTSQAGRTAAGVETEADQAVAGAGVEAEADQAVAVAGLETEADQAGAEAGAEAEADPGGPAARSETAAAPAAGLAGRAETERPDGLYGEHEPSGDGAAGAATVSTERWETLLRRRPAANADSPEPEAGDVEVKMEAVEDGKPEAELEPKAPDGLAAAKRSRRPRGSAADSALWRRVDGPSPYQCTVCHKQFQYLASIKIHARTHTGEKPHGCGVCGRRFALLSTLTNHQRLHSGDKPFKCADCGRAFAQQSYLCVHRRVHSTDKPFCCEQCGKTFKQAYYLNIHKRFHSGEKPYTCDDCGKSFATVSNFYKHQRGHRGDRQFCCEQCGKTFREHCQLRDHRRVHTGERPFSCDVCGMTFTLAKILARHARLHTGEKPYVCAECGKAFSRSENLRDHVKAHGTAAAAAAAAAEEAVAAAAEEAAVPAAAAAPPAGDEGYYMVDVMPVTGVQEALAGPVEVYRTETGVTVYKTLAEDGAALYQTETGEVFREMSGVDLPADAEDPFAGAEHAAPALPAYEPLGI